MAIAGSPGIPSCGVYVRDNRILTLPYTQNKPEGVVEQDPEQAARRLVAGEIVQIDMRRGNFGRIAKRAIELSGGKLELWVA